MPSSRVAIHAPAAGLGLTTAHFYPTSATSSSATIATLLSDGSMPNTKVNRWVQGSATAGIPFRLAEANTLSNGGKAGVSDTMAAALWIADTTFQAAAAGAVGELVWGLVGAVLALQPAAADVPERTCCCCPLWRNGCNVACSTLKVVCSGSVRHVIDCAMGAVFLVLAAMVQHLVHDILKTQRTLCSHARLPCADMRPVCLPAPRC